MRKDYDNLGISKNKPRNNPNLVPNLVTQITRPDTITSGSTKPGSVIEIQSSTVGVTQFTVGVGESIQNAINNANSIGGGIVYLQNGTHVQGGDLTLYSNVALQGENGESTIIDFQGKGYSLKIWGTQLYSTGTVSVSAGGTTVTGAGTSWTSALNGAQILLQGYYYPIETVNSGTSITLGAMFLGSSISGAAYSIDEPLNDVEIKELTVQNSSGNNIDIRNSDIVLLTNIASLYGGTGLYSNLASGTVINDMEIIGCGYGANLNNCSIFADTFIVNYTSTGYGINMNSVFSVTISNWSAEGCATVGLSMTNCWQADFFSGNINECGGIGLQMVSGNTQCTITALSAFANVSDGIQLTSNNSYNIFASCTTTGNGAYGINVANANCTGNVLNGNVYYSNTSGNYNNSGTSTRIF